MNKGNPIFRGYQILPKNVIITITYVMKTHILWNTLWQIIELLPLIAPERRHFGISGPWTFGPRNAGLWTGISVKNTQNLLLYMYAANFVCFWTEISGNFGPESSVSGSKVQAQGPAIPKCPERHHCSIFLPKTAVPFFFVVRPKNSPKTLFDLVTLSFDLWFWPLDFT